MPKEKSLIKRAVEWATQKETPTQEKIFEGRIAYYGQHTDYNTLPEALRDAVDADTSDKEIVVKKLDKICALYRIAERAKQKDPKYQLGDVIAKLIDYVGMKNEEEQKTFYSKIHHQVVKIPEETSEEPEQKWTTIYSSGNYSEKSAKLEEETRAAITNGQTKEREELEKMKNALEQETNIKLQRKQALIDQQREANKERFEILKNYDDQNLTNEYLEIIGRSDEKSCARVDKIISSLQEKEEVYKLQKTNEFISFESEYKELFPKNLFPEDNNKLVKINGIFYKHLSEGHKSDVEDIIKKISDPIQVEKKRQQDEETEKNRVKTVIEDNKVTINSLCTNQLQGEVDLDKEYGKIKELLALEKFKNNSQLQEKIDAINTLKEGYATENQSFLSKSLQTDKMNELETIRINVKDKQNVFKEKCTELVEKCKETRKTSLVKQLDTEKNEIEKIFEECSKQLTLLKSTAACLGKTDHPLCQDGDESSQNLASYKKQLDSVSSQVTTLEEFSQGSKTLKTIKESVGGLQQTLNKHASDIEAAVKAKKSEAFSGISSIAKELSLLNEARIKAYKGWGLIGAFDKSQDKLKLAIDFKKQLQALIDYSETGNHANNAPMTVSKDAINEVIQKYKNTAESPIPLDPASRKYGFFSNKGYTDNDRAYFDKIKSNGGLVDKLQEHMDTINTLTA